MTNHIQWLHQELERWKAQGVVSPEQAARIRSLYATPAGAAATGATPRETSWGTLALSGIGVVIVGLGIILLFAYNWNAIPRLVKLLLVVGSAGGAHAIGLFQAARGTEKRNSTELFCLLGTMFFGAGIWLVAQMYHIDEHFPNGFLIWGLGAMAMAWALRSIPQAIVATVLLTIWSLTEIMSFSKNVDFGLILIVAGIAPLAWMRRSALLAAVTIASVFILLTESATFWGSFRAGFPTAMAVSVFLVGAGHVLLERKDTETIANVCRFLGAAAFLVCLYMLTFEGVARELSRGTLGRGSNPVFGGWYRWGTFAAALIPWCWLAWRARAGKRISLDMWLIPLALLFAASTALMDRESVEAMAAPVMNLIAFLLAALWMVQGCMKGDPAKTIGGSLLLAAIVLARFFDLFDSLALRGAVFVFLGAALVAESFVYRRLRKKTAPPPALHAS